MRPTWAEVSLTALRRNFRAVQQHVGADVEICAVVKAHAYGHGLVECARALEAEGVRWLGVTSTEEGLSLRQGGVGTRILLLTGFWRDEEDAILDSNLTPVVSDWWQVGALESAAARRDFERPLPVHVKVDTGMSRLGIPFDYLEKFVQRVQAAPPLLIEGLMSHLAASEVPADPATAAQIERFREAEMLVARCGVQPRYFHLANSAAVQTRPQSWRNMVRPGLALYGYFLCEGPSSSPSPALEPILSWKTQVLNLRDIPAGQAVGYNHRWTADRPSRLATLPVGYADGLCRQLSSRGRVIVRGRFAPIVGNISMDLTLVDVTDVPGASLGDEVILLGGQGDCRVTVMEHASLAATVPYEVLCNISKRVPRHYLE